MVNIYDPMTLSRQDTTLEIPLFSLCQMHYITPMEGLLLIILAFALIIAEAHIPSFGLLGIAGIAALLAGGHFIVEQGGLFGIPLDWGFFLGIATVLAASMFIASYIAARHFKTKPAAGIEGTIGDEAKIVDWSGQAGRVHVQGELWAAHSLHPHNFAEGDIVIISGIDDMSLKIHPKE